MTAPLEGVLVLDLSRVLAGPFCTMLLADLGARVIKVEHPGGGDVTRGWGPPDHEETGLSAYYLSVNRNKESIALDLSKPSGAQAVRVLARRADVLIENFPPGGMEKFGLSLEDLRRENPRLITTSITGFGREGPDARSPGFDLLAQAGAGLMAVTGRPEGEPTKVGVAVSDLLAGCLAAVGIAAALNARERTGLAAHVETDLFCATLASLINVAQSCLLTGREAARHGNAHPQIVPYRTFSAADGEFALAVGTDQQFARLAELLGFSQWQQDPDYRTNEARVAHRERLERRLEEIFRAEARDVWLARFRAAGIPAGPVRGPLEALRSETARALRAVVETRGVQFVASPIRIDGHRARLGFPPALDADGDGIRREFGLPPGRQQ
ncbi:MAG TPA: CoA transferase [Thermoanaerobaculia bacterium]|nr:CoA transferase [Thermoanaerobaculia bacterium]